MIFAAYLGKGKAAQLSKERAAWSMSSTG